jgi:hypothetical protein
VERIPGWRGKPVHRIERRVSKIDLLVTAAATLFVLAGLVVTLMTGNPKLLGIAALVAVVAVPAITAAHGRD